MSSPEQDLGLAPIDYEAGRRVGKIAGPLTDSASERNGRLVAECKRRWPDFAITVTGAEVVARWTRKGQACALRAFVGRGQEAEEYYDAARGRIAWAALVGDEVRRASR